MSATGRAAVRVRPLDDGDQAWKRDALVRVWGSTLVARKGELIDAAPLDGAVAELGGDRAGLVTWARHGDELEVATLQAHISGAGVGRALLQAATDVARGAGARRLWLITTNDNTDALAFYQRCGWDLAALHHDAVTRARRELKPGIPLTGANDIPIRHELELELVIR
jgi:GNAT superfamily N-acetyltransferase